jgi:hypothetical protein
MSEIGNIKQELETSPDNEMSFLMMLIIMLIIAIPAGFIGLFIIIPLSWKIHRFFKKVFEEERRRVDAFHDNNDHDKVNVDKLC